MPHDSPPQSNVPVIVVIEAYPDICAIFPFFLKRYLKGSDAIMANSVEEARTALLADPTRCDRVAAFITHGVSRDQQVAPKAVAMMDKVLDRQVPYVVLSGAIDIEEIRLPRPPLAIVGKGERKPFQRCLEPLQRYFTTPPAPPT